MSWIKTSPMKEKIKFIQSWQSGDYTISELCKAYNVSRTTGHKLIRKFEKEGISCFVEKSKRPHFHPNKTSSKIEDSIIKLKKKHPLWGAKKLRKLLEGEIAKEKIPSLTTVNAILKRNNLVKERKQRGHRIVKLNPKFDPKTSNEIWSADYKGKFRLGNGRYCYVLTIADSKSRYIFSSKGHYYPTYKAVREEYTKVFKTYGLPYYLHTDNGTPFASAQSIHRFSKLSYWLIDLGVMPVFSDPGCPQQNGRHERMHKDLKASCANPPKLNLTKQQKMMDQFVKEYNEIRPHESLGMNTPQEVHQLSKRKYPNKIISYDYPYDYIKRQVTVNGTIRWGAYNWVYISTGLSKKYIGLKEMDEGIWKVYYRNVFLGSFNTNKINGKGKYLKLYNL